MLFVLEPISSWPPRLYVAIISVVKWLYFKPASKFIAFAQSHFPRHHAKTVSSRNNIPPVIGLFMKEGNVSDLY